MVFCVIFYATYAKNGVVAVVGSMRRYHSGRDPMAEGDPICKFGDLPSPASMRRNQKLISKDIFVSVFLHISLRNVRKKWGGGREHKMLSSCTLTRLLSGFSLENGKLCPVEDGSQIAKSGVRWENG